MRERGQVGVQAIGAAAVNQALKAIIVASGFLKEDGIELIFVAEFVDVEISGKVKSAMKFSVERRE
jgi:stage V sporulation protein S